MAPKDLFWVVKAPPGKEFVPPREILNPATQAPCAVSSILIEALNPLLGRLNQTGTAECHKAHLTCLELYRCH